MQNSRFLGELDRLMKMDSRKAYTKYKLEMEKSILMLNSSYG